MLTDTSTVVVVMAVALPMGFLHHKVPFTEIIAPPAGDTKTFVVGAEALSPAVTFVINIWNRNESILRRSFKHAGHGCVTCWTRMRKGAHRPRNF